MYNDAEIHVTLLITTWEPDFKIMLCYCISYQQTSELRNQSSINTENTEWKIFFLFVWVVFLLILHFAQPLRWHCWTHITNDKNHVDDVARTVSTIIIEWFVHWRMLFFIWECSMHVGSMTNDRRLPGDFTLWPVQGQTQPSRAGCVVVVHMADSSLLGVGPSRPRGLDCGPWTDLHMQCCHKT